MRRLVIHLRWLLPVGLIALTASVLMMLPSASTPMRPFEDLPAPPPQRSLAQQATGVEILRTEEGLPTLLLQADESRTWSTGELDLVEVSLRLFDPEGRETLVKAPRGTSSIAVEPVRPDPRVPQAHTGGPRAPTMGLEGIGSWYLDGGVELRRADDLVIRAADLAYLEREGRARTHQAVEFTRGPARGTARGMIYDVNAQRLVLENEVRAFMQLGAMGQVSVEAAAGVYDLHAGTFEMSQYRARTERGELLAGSKLRALFRKEGGVSRLEGEEGFILETTHAIADTRDPSPLSRLLALEGTRTMEGQRLAVSFGEDAIPRTIEVSGEANLTAREEGSEGAPARIAAQTLMFDLVNGSLRHARARGNVDLQGATQEGEGDGFQLLSENLDAALDPNSGSIVHLEGQGRIRLTDRDLLSQGSMTFLDPNTDVVTLAGEAGQPARATWAGRKIQADRIEADRRRRVLHARGDVRTSYRPDDSAPQGDRGGALPFFRGGETIHAMAGTLTFGEDGASAHYSDHVRLWQSENRLEASQVDIQESEGRLEARGDVISSFRQAAQGPRAGAQGDEIVTVAAATMIYERPSRRVTYRGGVLLTQGALRVSSETLEVRLGAESARAEQMIAVGGVELRDIGRTGRGDRLVVDLAADTMKLTGLGREALVQDEAGQQVVRGSSLTMERSSDRILVESELGGRTWILLKPRGKGAPRVGSDPEN